MTEGIYADAPTANAPAVRGFVYEKAVGFLLWPTILLGSIAFLEPSPYDLFLILLIPVWFFGGFRFHAVLIPLFFIMFVRIFSEHFSIFPYLQAQDEISYVLYSYVCTILALFFALFFSNNTVPRLEIFLKAYFISCLVASVFAYVGYFDIGGTAAALSPVGRALGSFKDPNVMGSYCVLGSLFALQRVLLKQTRHTFLMIASFLFINGAILITFSRGSWAALLLGIAMVTGFSFITSTAPLLRRRILIVFLSVLALVAAAMLILLANSDFRTFFLERAVLTQEYDGGATGRFGNQLRSLPMLLDRLWGGFGPLRFRLIFDLEPHNSFIGGFANAGIIGGFTYIALVLVTCFVGFRLCLTYSPFQRQAQVLWPSLFAHFIQSAQIDVDHWRFLFMVLGAVWGMEAARAMWQARGAPPVQAALGTDGRRLSISS